ncbi:MAG: DUF167 domain-containing protein [Pseudotabrizicola sp.]|uniref:DUF167 domain-containing protein n=1 Tax=Pseudotabrizicola sp. TaxID=2939647 RepID=UPI002731A074|nr:DUF167 domain-containing protein [Pseudotabrizicola sp.]MDP2081443.1 DUF167 domain-containing protein [Pseudotabrizicola sp.]MDZ7572956.1 DUF167 domain-containing protein [Pseudotabrizicola sp.]
MTKGLWAHLAAPGAEFHVRATPRARQPGLSFTGGKFQIGVTAPADDGRANAAVTETLAHALGVAKTRLTLVRGVISRDKTFRLD